MNEFKCRVIFFYGDKQEVERSSYIIRVNGDKFDLSPDKTAYPDFDVSDYYEYKGYKNEDNTYSVHSTDEDETWTMIASGELNIDSFIFGMWANLSFKNFGMVQIDIL